VRVFVCAGGEEEKPRLSALRLATTKRAPGGVERGGAGEGTPRRASLHTTCPPGPQPPRIACLGVQWWGTSRNWRTGEAPYSVLRCAVVGHRAQQGGRAKPGIACLGVQWWGTSRNREDG
jgi:hypothetical protein